MALLAGALVAASCAKKLAAPVDPVAPPVPAPSVAASAPEPVATGVVTASPARPTSDARVFACGQRTCRVGEETCCAHGDEGVCVRSLPDDAPHGQTGYLASQWAACDKVSFAGGGSFDHMDRCDESADCASGQICCEQFLFSGGTLDECAPPRPNGATPCDFVERCVDGAPCRLAGTECIEGVCQKPTPNLRCGEAACGGNGSVCCGDPPTCKAAAECGKYSRIACAADADCVQGQRCMINGHGTMCLSFAPDPANPNYVCGRDADCPSACGSPKVRMRCEASLIPGMKYCSCPD